jgi:DNA-binding MarR family transcriptional regulator
MKEEYHKLSKYTGGIYRCTQTYMNELLKPYGLSSASCPYLLALYHEDGINQNQLSKELSVDKAMSARELKKLINEGYVKKEVDKKDTRANKLYLTNEGKSMIPAIRREISVWNDAITQELNEKEKNELIRMLDVVLIKAKQIRSLKKDEE